VEWFKELLNFAACFLGRSAAREIASDYLSFATALGKLSQVDIPFNEDRFERYLEFVKPDPAVEFVSILDVDRGVESWSTLATFLMRRFPNLKGLCVQQNYSHPSSHLDFCVALKSLQLRMFVLNESQTEFIQDLTPLAFAETVLPNMAPNSWACLYQIYGSCRSHPVSHKEGRAGVLCVHNEQTRCSCDDEEEDLD
jgi:hypothetical protein